MNHTTRAPEGRLVSIVAILSFVAACGGKIVEDPNARPGDSAPASSPSADGPAASPAPAFTSTSRSVADACGVVCSRNASCGALQVDCEERCALQIGAGACAPSGTAYIQCWADALTDRSCLVLPPVCEDAYCAFTRCAGMVVPDYCR